MHYLKDFFCQFDLYHKRHLSFLRVSFQDIPLPVEEKPEKQEYAIATYLKKHCPVKRTKFLNHQVNYFYGKLISHQGEGSGCIMWGLS